MIVFFAQIYYHEYLLSTPTNPIRTGRSDEQAVPREDHPAVARYIPATEVVLRKLRRLIPIVFVSITILFNYKLIIVSNSLLKTGTRTHISCTTYYTRHDSKDGDRIAGRFRQTFGKLFRGLSKTPVPTAANRQAPITAFSVF